MQNISLEKIDVLACSSKVSVIIPSLDGHRDGNIDILKHQILSQTLKPIEIIVVSGIHPNGKARNEGVKKASGDFYVFIDDDATLGNENVIENLIKPFLERNDVGMTGPSQLIPDDSNKFQISAARQIPRSLFPVQSSIVDSDMVCHMCLAMPAKLFKEVGWENPDIVSGTDPDLRVRVRRAGYRICVVPQTWAYHPMPKNLGGLMKLAYFKGRNSAIVRKTHPHLIFELDSGFNIGFSEKINFPYRIMRKIINLMTTLLNFRFILFFYLISYSAGNILQSFGNLLNRSHGNK